MPLARGCKIPGLACRLTYMSFGAKFSVLTAAVLALAACGGSGGPPPQNLPVVTVSPSTAQVLAGATQQMTATSSDGSTSFTWQVNGVIGGNSSFGTISVNGLYTAPDLPPTGGGVTVEAIEPGNTVPGTAVLTFGFSNASLHGGYVFNLRGSNQAVPWFAIGEFIANGTGQIGSGLQDVNNGTAIQTKAAFTGSYSINPDGSGNLMLGSLGFQLVMQPDGQALLMSASSGTTLTGSLSVQDPAASGVAAFNGPLVLNSAGQAGNQGFGQLALVSAGSGSTFSGFEDVNGQNPLIRAPWSGSYAFDGNAHGTLTIKDSNGTHAYSFYVISASNFALLSTDTSVTALGNLSSQTPGVYSSASLDGPYVFLLNGNNATQGYAQLGQFNPNGLGNVGTVTEDINTPGNLQIALTTTGTYTLDPSVYGRGTLTLNNQGTGAPSTYVFYMLSPQQADVMTTNSTVVAGGFIFQGGGGGFSDAVFNGAYGFALNAQTGIASLSTAVGTLDLDGMGNLSGKMIQNLNGSVSSTLSLSGTYNLTGATRGTATLTSSGGGSSPFAVYPVNRSQFLLIGTDATSPYTGIVFSRNP